MPISTIVPGDVQEYSRCKTYFPGAAFMSAGPISVSVSVYGSVLDMVMAPSAESGSVTYDCCSGSATMTCRASIIVSSGCLWLKTIAVTNRRMSMRNMILRIVR